MMNDAAHYRIQSLVYESGTGKDKYAGINNNYFSFVALDR